MIIQHKTGNENIASRHASRVTRHDYNIKEDIINGRKTKRYNTGS